MQKYKNLQTDRNTIATRWLLIRYRLLQILYSAFGRDTRKKKLGRINRMSGEIWANPEIWLKARLELIRSPDNHNL